jgi:hypothetical protein
MPTGLTAPWYGPTIDSMAIPVIKTTYALDAETVRALEQMARRWGTSKSEALRRAIRASAATAGDAAGDAVAALDRLQRAAALSAADAQAWSRSVRAERRAASTRRARNAR